MVRLKPVAIPIMLIYFGLNLVMAGSIFNCSGNVVSPTVLQTAKIKAARYTFKRDPKVSKEPNYFIKTTPCYDAAAFKGKNTIIFSEAVVRDFSIEELAAMMGHEFGHLESRQKMEHWEIDAIGVELAGRSAMLGALNKSVFKIRNMFDDNQILIYVFPFSYLSYHLAINQFKSRIEKIENLSD